MSLLDWTKSETISQPDKITIAWNTDPSGNTQSVEKKQVLFSTTKSTSTSSYETLEYVDIDGNVKTQDVEVKKEDIKECTKASVNQEWIKTRLKYGLGLPSGGDKERSVTEREYKATVDGLVVVREVTEVYISYVSFAGQMQRVPYQILGQSSPPQNLYYNPSDNEIISHRTIIEWEYVKTKEGRDVTRTKTSRWVALGLTSEGKTSYERRMWDIENLVARFPQTYPAVIIITLQEWSELVFQGTEVQVSTGRIPIPSKPSDSDLAANEVTNGTNPPSDALPEDIYGNSPTWLGYLPVTDDRTFYEKYGFPENWRDYVGDSNGDGVPDWADYVPEGIDWKTLDTSDTDYKNPEPLTSNEKSITGRVVFDGQNYDDNDPTVTATYNMPFAPDDYFYYDSNRIRRLARGGAKNAAIKFGQTEAALDIGHAFGQNIVTNFANTPTLDLSPVYVRLAGIEGAFLLDGASYAWGPEGMVASSDLMLVGVTGYDGASAPSTSWIRLPVAPAGIGPAGATTIEASPVKANSISIPGGFDIRSPGAVLASLPTNGVDVFHEWRSNAPVVPPSLVLEAEVIASGPAITAREFPYGLTLETDAEILTTGPAVDFIWLTQVAPPAAAVVIEAIAPTVSSGASIVVPAAAVEVAASAPLVASGASIAVPAADITVEGRAPDRVGQPKIVINVPAADILVAAAVPKVASGGSVAVPVTDVAVTGVAPAITAATNPIPALSPVLWYDFADESTVTVDSSQITQVTDKGSRGWTLTKIINGPAYNTGINGRKCVDYGSAGHSLHLRNASTTSTNIAEIYIVLDANFGSTFPTTNGLITQGTGTTGWGITGGPGTAGLSSANFDQAYINNSASNQFSSVLTAVNTPSLLRIKKSNDAAFATTAGFMIGNDKAQFNRGWGGLIGEVVVFTSPLSSTNRAAVQNWLASKWGLTLS